MRVVTTPQVILGHHIPKGTFIACSPLANGRDPHLFPRAERFEPERWLTPTGELNKKVIKGVSKAGTSIHFGKGEHSCLGKKLAKAVVFLYWSLLLGDERTPGFEVEIISGVKEGRGIDNVGVEGAWITENLGTPMEKSDDPVKVRLRKRTQ
jgi:hypothetical protein